MSCEKYLEMISDEVDTELKESESLFLMRHLVLCRDCRNEYSDNLKLKDILKEELIHAPVFVPTGFSAKVVDIIEKNSPADLVESSLLARERPNLSGLIEGIKGLFPANAPSFALPLAASLLMAISLSLYYKTSPEGTDSGYVLTDAKNIDAKVIETKAASLSQVEDDEFAYYADRHSNAVHQASLDNSVVSKRGGVIYAGYASTGLGRR